MSYSASFSGKASELPDPLITTTFPEERQAQHVATVNEGIRGLVASVASGDEMVNVSAYGHVNAELGGDTSTITISTPSRPAEE